MVLNVSYDPTNSKKIFGFDDLTLVNEKGEEWGPIMNGVTSGRPDYSSDIFSSVFTDALGKSLNSGRHGILSPSEKPGYDQTLTIALPDNISYQSPITFQLVDYPNRITGEFDIRIK